MDFTSLLNNLSATETVVSITSLAAVFILPNVASWGYNKVISWFSDTNESQREEDVDRDNEAAWRDYMEGLDETEKYDKDDDYFVY